MTFVRGVIAGPATSHGATIRSPINAGSAPDRVGTGRACPARGVLLKQRILVSALGVGALAVAGLTAQGATAAPTPYAAGKHATKVCTTATTPHTAACSALKLVNDKGVVP